MSLFAESFADMQARSGIGIDVYNFNLALIVKSKCFQIYHALAHFCQSQKASCCRRLGLHDVAAEEALADKLAKPASSITPQHGKVL